MDSPPARLARPVGSLRRYAGAYEAHEHAHAQVLLGLDGALELELAGRAAFVDAACGLVVPAGVSHRFLAAAGANVLVIDSPPRLGLERVRRFMLPAGWRDGGRPFDAEAALEAIAGAPRVLARRRLDTARLDAALAAALHEPWTTARMAALQALSPQRFHARLVELTGLAPQAYLRRRRLDEAMRLLRAGLSLDAAALQVGYRTASALAHALRRDRGLGARDVRGARPAAAQAIDTPAAQAAPW